MMLKFMVLNWISDFWNLKSVYSLILLTLSLSCFSLGHYWFILTSNWIIFNFNNNFCYFNWSHDSWSQQIWYKKNILNIQEFLFLLPFLTHLPFLFIQAWDHHYSFCILEVRQNSLVFPSILTLCYCTVWGN